MLQDDPSVSEVTIEGGQFLLEGSEHRLTLLLQARTCPELQPSPCGSQLCASTHPGLPSPDSTCDAGAKPERV